MSDSPSIKFCDLIYFENLSFGSAGFSSATSSFFSSTGAGAGVSSTGAGAGASSTGVGAAAAGAGLTSSV